MDFNQFKKLFQETIKKDIKETEGILTRFQDENEQSRKVLEGVIVSTSFGKNIETVVYEKNGNESNPIVLTRENRPAVTERITTQIKEADEIIAHAQETLIVLKDQLDLFKYNDVFLIDGSPLLALITIYIFSNRMAIPIETLSEVLKIFVGTNSRYFAANPDIEFYQDALLNNEAKRAAKLIYYLGKFYTPEGKPTHCDTSVTISQAWQAFCSYSRSILYASEEDVTKICDTIEQIATKEAANYGLEPQEETKSSKKKVTATTSNQPLKSQAVREINRHRQELKKYIRNDKVVAPCDEETLLKILALGQYDEKESTYYLKLMREHNLTERRSSLPKETQAELSFFTSEEQALFNEAKSSSIIAVQHIYQELQTLLELSSECPDTQDYITHEKNTLFATLRNLIPKKTPLLYLDDTLNPAIAKSVAKLSKQEKSNVHRLLNKLQKGLVANAVAVKGSPQNKKILYVTAYSLRVCYYEYAQGEYLILSIGKNDTTFSSAIKIASSPSFAKFLENLKLESFRNELTTISSNYLTELDQSLTKEFQPKLNPPA